LSKRKPSKKHAESGGKLGLLVNPEEEGDMFNRKVGLLPKYNILQPRRLILIFYGDRKIILRNINTWAQCPQDGGP
jgi:hypothetical protein